MAIKSKQIRWMIAIAALIFIVILIYSSVKQNEQTYEVCVDFKGSSHCASAAGATSDEALRSAQQIDCELLSHSREENMVCLDRAPASIKKLAK